MRKLKGLRRSARGGRVVDKDDSLTSRLTMDVAAAGVGHSLAVDVDSGATSVGRAVVGAVRRLAGAVGGRPGRIRWGRW